MKLSKTAKAARARARRTMNRDTMWSSKWPEEWQKEYVRKSRGPIATITHQIYELQMAMFMANNKDGWHHEREDLSVVSERSREAADIDLVLNDEYFK